jgi:hypothetical protein
VLSTKTSKQYGRRFGIGFANNKADSIFGDSADDLARKICTIESNPCGYVATFTIAMDI